MAALRWFLGDLEVIHEEPMFCVTIHFHEYFETVGQIGRMH